MSYKWLHTLVTMTLEGSSHLSLSLWQRMKARFQTQHIGLDVEEELEVFIDAIEDRLAPTSRV